MKKHLLQSGGSVKDAQGQDVNVSNVTQQLTQLTQAGRISNRDASRILKGLKQVETSVAGGVTYSLGRKNTFTAQKDGQDIEGKASGLNVAGNFINKNLSGRKVSKAIGFIHSQQKELPNPDPVQPKGIVTQTLDSKNIQLPSIAGADMPGLTFTPSAASTKPDPNAGKEVPQATQKHVSATQKHVSAQKNVSTQKPPLAFVASQKTTGNPVTKTRLPVREASKPLPKTVEEAIPVLDLYTVEDAAREQAAKKAASKKAEASKMAVREAALKNNLFASKQTAPAPAPSTQKQEAGFGQTLYNWANQSLQRQGQEEKNRIQQQNQQAGAQRKADLERLIGSKLSLEHVAEGLAQMKKYPHLKSYRFFLEDGITSPRYYFTLTPDGKITAESDPSVFTTPVSPYQKKESTSGLNFFESFLPFESLPQKKEDGGLTYSLGSRPIIDPKKKFIPALNPIGIDTSYQMPQKTLPVPAASSVGSLQKAIGVDFKTPLARQLTVTDASSAGKEKTTDWLRLANAGLGVAGALSYATAKRPILSGPIKFESTILPVTGLSEVSKRMAQTQIAQQTAQANQLANTADNRFNTVLKLQANYNANQALTNLAAQDSEVYQQNLHRVNEQQNRDAYLNYQAQQNYNQQKFELDNQYYQQHRDMGIGMAQNALTYEVQRKVDLENKRILESQTNQQLAAMAEQAIIQANTTRILQGKPALTPQEEKAIREQYVHSQTSNYSKPILRLQR